MFFPGKESFLLHSMPQHIFQSKKIMKVLARLSGYGLIAESKGFNGRFSMIHGLDS